MLFFLGNLYSFEFKATKIIILKFNAFQLITLIQYRRLKDIIITFMSKNKKRSKSIK